MKHRLVTGLAAVSFLLCLATGAMWARSYFKNDLLVYRHSRFLSLLGGFHVFDFEYERPGPMAFDSRPISSSSRWDGWPYESNKTMRFGGFLYVSDDFRDGFKHITATRIPYWFLVMLLALPATAWLIHHRRRFAPGHCRTCGYDLRATRDRCPECGTIAGPV